MESRRQQKVSSFLQEILSEIFQKYGSNYYGRAFVTITSVIITPDLFTAKIYLSVFNVTDKDETVNSIIDHASEIRKHLGTRIKHHVRRVPELLFYLDNTLDEAIKVNELLKEIKKK